MALVGKLEDMPPADIMIFIAESEKTGKLRFTTGTQEGMIVFRQGKIIYAASSSLRETFGSIALNLGIVNRVQLNEALLRQVRSNEEKRLGEILVELSVITHTDVEQVLAHQVGRVVAEIFEWKKGYFKFTNLEFAEYGDIDVDARDFIVASPLDTRSVALDAARAQDEISREAELEEDGQEEAAEATTMAEIMDDVPAPVLTAEIIREIFDVAETLFARGVILAVHENSAQGLAQFGLVDTIATPNERVRNLNLPFEDYSIISRVVHDRQIFRGEPDHIRSNSQLVLALGGEWPHDGVAIPMLIGDRVGLVFYGDNQPTGQPVGSTVALEETMQTVGSLMVQPPRSS